MRNEVRLTRGEYWILELVVQAGHPITILDAPNLSAIVNKPSHGLNKSELIVTLEYLIANKLIETYSFKLDEHGHFSNTELIFPLTGPALLTAFTESYPFAQNSTNSATYYHLTKEGAEVWDSFAQPNWRHFVLDDSNTESGLYRFSCQDRAWQEHYLNCFFLIEEDRNGLTLDGAITLDELSNWQATYWKTIPSGVRATFNCKRGTKSDQVGPTKMQQLLLSGFCEVRDGWYQWR